MATSHPTIAPLKRTLRPKLDVSFRCVLHLEGKPMFRRLLRLVRSQTCTHAVLDSAYGLDDVTEGYAVLHCRCGRKRMIVRTI